MPVPDYESIQTSSDELDRVQGAIDKFVEDLTHAEPILAGRQINNIILTSGSNTLVEHKLNRKPQGFIVTGVRDKSSGPSSTTTKKLVFTTPDFTINGSSDPGTAVVSNFRMYSFDDTTEEYIYGSFVVPDDYVTASDIVVKLYAGQLLASTTNSVDWNLLWSRARSGVATTSLTTLTGHADSYLAGFTARETTLTTLSSPALQAEDIVGYRLSRDATDATNDTATGDAVLMAMVLEYTATASSDTDGSVVDRTTTDSVDSSVYLALRSDVSQTVDIWVY